MDYQKINDQIYVYTDKTFYDVVAGAIVLPTKLLMIDSGIHLGEIKEFREIVEKETGKKFEYLICTHYDGDHTFGNQIFADCKIVAPKIQLEHMKRIKEYLTPENIQKEQSGLADPKALKGLVITLPNDIFENQYEIVDGDIKVILKHTGGHTEDSVYVYCPEYKALFTGDNLFVNSYPYGGHKDCNPDIWIETLKEFLTLDIDLVVPGHGPVTNKEYIKKTITALEQVKNTMLSLKEKGKSEKEILEYDYANYFPPVKSEAEEKKTLKEISIKQWHNYWLKEKK